MDTVSPETRSRVMGQVRSNRNKSTEWRVRAILIRNGIRGWSLYPSDLRGKPDFVFRAKRIALFLDGCFWHGCPKCKKVPASNTAYWTRKIEGNRKRDRATSAQLRRDGWKVLRIWEHQLKNLERVLARIKRALA